MLNRKQNYSSCAYLSQLMKIVQTYSKPHQLSLTYTKKEVIKCSNAAIIHYNIQMFSINTKLILLSLYSSIDYFQIKNQQGLFFPLSRKVIFIINDKEQCTNIYLYVVNIDLQLYIYLFYYSNCEENFNPRNEAVENAYSTKSYHGKYIMYLSIYK